jgi:hypothetical protein
LIVEFEQILQGDVLYLQLSLHGATVALYGTIVALHSEAQISENHFIATTNHTLTYCNWW